jgi:hypothetical protein
MKATLLLHSKNIKGDEVVEIKIWQVPRSVDKPHGVKFSVAYIKSGKRVLGYDNAEGKGYHKHYADEEEPYPFVDIWKLLDEFKKELRGIRGREWDEN